MTEHDLMLEPDDHEEPLEYRVADEEFESLLDRDFLDSLYNQDYASSEALTDWEMEREYYAES